MGNLDQTDSPESNATGLPTEDPLEIQIPEGVPPETRGSKQFALFAFIAIFAAILGSAVLYLVSRRVAPAPEPVQTTAAVAPVPATPPVKLPVPEPAAQQPAPDPVQEAPPPQPSSIAPVVEPSAVPQAGRLYLQVGSLEKRVAEIMSQGLRIKGIPAMVAPGVTPVVSRIIAGPFDDTAQMSAADKQLREMGFQPFPRKFDPSELVEPPPQTAAAPEPTAATPKPDVRR